MRPNRCELGELIVVRAPLPLVEHENAYLCILGGRGRLAITQAMIGKEGGDIRRIGPVEQRCGITMMLKEIEESAVLLGYAEVENVGCSLAKVAVQGLDVLIEKAR